MFPQGEGRVLQEAWGGLTGYKFLLTYVQLIINSHAVNVTPG